MDKICNLDNISDTVREGRCLWCLLDLHPETRAFSFLSCQKGLGKIYANSGS